MAMIQLQREGKRSGRNTLEMWSAASPFRAFRINLFAPDFTFIFFPPFSPFHHQTLTLRLTGWCWDCRFIAQISNLLSRKTVTHGHSLQERVTVARMPLQMVLLLLRASSHKNAVCQVENESITAMAQSFSVRVRLKMAAVNQ